MKIQSRRPPSNSSPGLFTFKAPTHRPDSNQQPTIFIRPLCCIEHIDIHILHILRLREMQ